MGNGNRKGGAHFSAVADALSGADRRVATRTGAVGLALQKKLHGQFRGVNGVLTSLLMVNLKDGNPKTRTLALLEAGVVLQSSALFTRKAVIWQQITADCERSCFKPISEHCDVEFDSVAGFDSCVSCNGGEGLDLGRYM